MNTNMKNERSKVYEFKQKYYMNNPIIYHGKHRGHKMYIFRNPDDNLAAVCPVLSVFSIDDGRFNNDEDLIIEDLKDAINLTIETVRK